MVRKLALTLLLVAMAAPLTNFSSALAAGPRMDDNGAP